MPVPSSLSPWERWHRVSDDGEGKLVSKEHPHSAMHWLLSERYYRSSCNFPAASLPSQALRAKAGLRHPASASLSLASCWPLPQQLLPVSAAGGGRRRCPQRGSLGRSAPCPLYKYTENPVGKGRSAGKTQKNRFPSCQTGQNALFYSHSLTV